MATVSKGRTFVSGETVTPAKLNELVDNATVANIQTADIADGQITNAKVNASAAIAHSKLANITAGQVLLGNASNVPTATALTGDVTVTSAGVTAIGSAKVLPAMLSQPYTLDTSKASTSGTSIDFTGIPSWAKRITVMFSEVSTNGTAEPLIQLGAGSVTTSGYSAASSVVASTVATTSNSSGIPIYSVLASDQLNGVVRFENVSGNTWIASGVISPKNGLSTVIQAGAVTLSGALDRVRITTATGTNTFDNGTINIAYEG